MQADPSSLRRAIAVACAGAMAVAGAGHAAQPPERAQARAAGQAQSAASPTFSRPTRIDNRWLPLSSIERSVLRGTKEGRRVRSVITPLERTKAFRIHGSPVRAMVVKDRAYENGKLHEVALDYYAQADDGTVYYLGEDVDIYNRAGTRVVSHEGAFLYGRDTRTLGVAMPARPRKGARFTFERVPGLGSERNRVVSTTARVSVPGGTFSPALKIRSYHRPDAERELKWYAPGVGLLKEQGPTGGVELVSPATR